VINAQNFENVSFLETAGRSIGRFIFPAALLGGMYASMTCLMDEARGRDKPISNGFLGGAVAGAVLATRTHSAGKMASYAVGFGLLGMFGRVVGTNLFIRPDTEYTFDQLHESINIAEMRHLAPPQRK
jgi:hypothetical protein